MPTSVRRTRLRMSVLEKLFIGRRGAARRPRCRIANQTLILPSRLSLCHEVDQLFNYSIGSFGSCNIRSSYPSHLNTLASKGDKSLVCLRRRFPVVCVSIDFYDEGQPFVDHNEIWFQSVVLLSDTHKHGQRSNGESSLCHCFIKSDLGFRSKEKSQMLLGCYVVASYPSLVCYSFALDEPHRILAPVLGSIYHLWNDDDFV